jgi:hypothetical protein
MLLTVASCPWHGHVSRAAHLLYITTTELYNAFVLRATLLVEWPRRFEPLFQNVPPPTPPTPPLSVPPPSHRLSLPLHATVCVPPPHPPPQTDAAFALKSPMLGLGPLSPSVSLDSCVEDSEVSQPLRPLFGAQMRACIDVWPSLLFQHAAFR